MPPAAKKTAAAAKTAAKKAAPATKRAAKKTTTAAKATASKTTSASTETNTSTGKTKGDDAPPVDHNAPAPNSPPIQSSSPDPTMAAGPTFAGVGAAPNHDDEDVPAALERKTQDGSGLKDDNEDDVPESDFHSFATQGVEKEDK